MMSIEEVLKLPGNETCADCGNPGPRWLSCGPAVFVCDACAQIHRQLQPPPADQFVESPFGGASDDRANRYCVLEVSSVAVAEDSQLLKQLLTLGGNEQAKRRYEQRTPISYRRPTPSDPLVLHEEWIRAKYERLEFVDDDDGNGNHDDDGSSDQLQQSVDGVSSMMTSLSITARSQSPFISTPSMTSSTTSCSRCTNILPRSPRSSRDRYISGYKDGFLWKQGREDRRFNKRWFVLDEDENTLRYYNQDNMHEPKNTYRIDGTNVVLIPDKLDHPNAMQITYEVNNGQTRNIFVYAETGIELVEWYSCIRWVKFNRLLKANPNKSPNEVVSLLPLDFTREGWLSKAGPKKTGAYRRRWMTLDGNRLRYFKDPLDAFARGEVTLGTGGQGFAVVDGVLPTAVRHPSNELLTGVGVGSNPATTTTKHNSAVFTLVTPTRHYRFMADDTTDKVAWVQSLAAIIESPVIRYS